MKKKFKKMISFVLLMIMVFQAISPSVVLAVDVSNENGNEVIITGSTGLNGTAFEYANGNVHITKKHGDNDLVDITTSTFSVELGDIISIKLYADDGYVGKLIKGEDEEITLSEGEYTFTIGQEIDNTLSFTPSFVADNSNQIVKFDFNLNGEDFTGIGNGDVLFVDQDFNFDTISNLYFNTIDINNGETTYEYADNEYSNNLVDSEGRDILEVNVSRTSDNFIVLRIKGHGSDIQEQDYAYMKGADDYYDFYIPELYLVKPAFEGVEITTDNMPDNYDFTFWNGVDLVATSSEDFGRVSVYYGDNTINFESKIDSDIKSISLVSDMGVPESAVTINNTSFEVTIHSNYYNEIPLKIELLNGTVGYVIVERIGIFIGEVKAGDKVFYHGASAGVGENLDVDTDKNRLVAVFYHENTKVYEDYKLIVNATYEDGRTETTIAIGVGDVPNSSGNITGSDFILWEGNDDMPVEVSVIAVDAEALSDENSFGGATFGSGNGVTWERD